jgi:hypothetical protein
MLRKLLIVGVVALLPSLAMAVPQEGDWELILAGSGASDNDFDNHALGAEAQVGYYVADPLEVYVRQSLAWADAEGSDSIWNGSTRVGLDYHFQIGDNWRPFVGANIGYTYGDTTDDSWVASLEGGVKYYVNASTFIYGIVEYQFLVEESFGDGAFVYALGIGFNF